MRNMRNMRSMGRKGQGGFIQNFIIPGIILIGVVIAGIAMLSGNTGGNDTSNEQASMSANGIMTQSIVLATAINRAEADGTITSVGVPTDVSLTPLVTANYISGALPAPPPNSQTAFTAWKYGKSSAPAKDATNADVGTAAGDDIIYLDNVTDAVCRRINNKLYTTATTAAAAGTFTIAANIPTVATNVAANVLDVNRQAGAAEGCLKNGAGYTYYKVINIK